MTTIDNGWHLIAEEPAPRDRDITVGWWRPCAVWAELRLRPDDLLTTAATHWREAYPPPPREPEPLTLPPRAVMALEKLRLAYGSLGWGAPYELALHRAVATVLREVEAARKSTETPS